MIQNGEILDVFAVAIVLFFDGVVNTNRYVLLVGEGREEVDPIGFLKIGGGTYYKFRAKQFMRGGKGI